MKRGILLVALGHRNYFEMAKALAASIKVNDPDLPICVVTEGNRLVDAALFDQAVVADPQIYMVGENVEYIKAKLHLYELSPFQETIFLDVDQIVLPGRKLSRLFTEVQGLDLTMSNTGEATVSIWANVEEVKALYGDKPFWNVHSELIYFRKSKAARVFFDTAKRVYRQAKVTSATRFAGATMADELAFQIACMQTGTYPHKPGWLPNYWHARNEQKGLYPYQLAKLGYYTYSIGGAHTPPSVTQHYNNLAAHYHRVLGLQNPYQVRNKRSFLPERQKI